MSATSGPVILYVDDDWANRVVFETAFGRRFRLKIVASGAEALEVLAAEPVAVLVTDQRMPKMSGTELLLRVRDEHPDIVRMISTAYSDLEPILRAVNDGLVARYLVKPWDAEELERILAWGLEAFEAGRQSTEIQQRLLQTERLVTLGGLAAAVLHDLRQPLTMLHYTIEHLRALELEARRTPEATGALLAELPELIAELDSGLRSGLDMVASVQLLAEPVGDADAQRSCEPVPVVELAVRLTRRLFGARGHQLELVASPRPPPVALDRSALFQTIQNLLTNAGQALDRVPARRGQVRVRVEAVEGGVRFAVADDGPGMSAEALASAGRPFSRHRPGGTGLGLSQCRRFVEGAGGKLEIESGPGVGTTVAFTLPLAT